MEYIPRRKWRYPFAVEKGYYKLLKKYINTIFNAYEAKHEYVKTLMINSSIKIDSDDTVSDFMEALASDITSPDDFRPSIKNTLDILNGFNKKEFADILQSIHVNALTNESWYKQYSQQWTSENLNLIKSIHDDILRRIESQLRDAISTTVEDGVKLKYLENKIKELTGIADKRAKLIARDQVGKANGRITQYRQESTGIKKYTWRSVGDERVRESHSERDGQIFLWKKAPEGGHPGIAINCRCVALPVINFDALAESGAYVPRANREAVREAMKRWGVNKGELYKKVVGADPVPTNPPSIKPKPTPEVPKSPTPKPVATKPPIKVEPPIIKEPPKTKVPTKPAEVTRPVEPPKVVKAKKPKKITKKAIIDKYAERFKERNIVINHTFSGFDKRMIFVTLKQFDNLLKKFPVITLGNSRRPFVIEAAPTRSPNYMAAVGWDFESSYSVYLRINNKYFKKWMRYRTLGIDKKTQHIYRTKKGVVRGTISHEFGHIIHNHLIVERWNNRLVGEYGSVAVYREALVRDMVREIKAEAMRINNNQSVDIYMSEYGDSSPFEWFAEAFAHSMTTSDKEMSPIGKAMLWFLNKEELLNDDNA